MTPNTPKRYRLKKDLPGFEKGATAIYLSSIGFYQLNTVNEFGVYLSKYDVEDSPFFEEIKQPEENGLPKCTLNDQELIHKVKWWVQQLCSKGGRAWTLRVPVDVNHDPDVIINELCDRFEAALNDNAGEQGGFRDESIITVNFDVRDSIEKSVDILKSALLQQGAKYHFISGVDVFCGNLEWNDTSKSVATFKFDPNGKWQVKYQARPVDAGEGFIWDDEAVIKVIMSLGYRTLPISRTECILAMNQYKDKCFEEHLKQSKQQPSSKLEYFEKIPDYLERALDGWVVAHKEFDTGYRNVDGNQTRINISILSQNCNQADTSLRKAINQYKAYSKPRIGNDNICPITKLQCDDETCTPGAECNISGGEEMSPSPSNTSSNEGKDWAIIEFIGFDGKHYYNSKGVFSQVCDRGKIISVKRLSGTPEIFTVGDEVMWDLEKLPGQSRTPFKIKSFEINDILPQKRMFCNNNNISIEYLQKLSPTSSNKDREP